LSLAPLPDDFQFTREQLHQIAFFALAPTRYEAEERMGLRATPRGFGTPEFGGRQARVEGNLLVHEQEGNIATQPISSIRAAAEFFGTEYEVNWFPDFKDPLPPMDPDRPLKIAEAPSLALADWFQFGTDALEELRIQCREADDVSEVQLWPEHFDPAIEIGSESEGKRASYGASAGDKGHLDPYLYVSAWSEIDKSNPYWNDRHFNGASLPYSELLAADDQKRVAIDFFTWGYEVLHN